MKLLRYGPRGQEKPGLLDAAGVLRDLSGVVPDICGEVLGEAGLARLRALDPAALPAVRPDVRIGACVGRVGKIIGVGLNYSDHAAETGKSAPREPILFSKATSSLCGPNDPIELPRGAQKGDWEVELAVVIGTRAKYVRREEALSHVAGWCLFNDVSERAMQSERGGDWMKGKSHDSFGPCGPWLVTRDELPDPQDIALRLSVDGVLRQDGHTRNMIFPVDELISYISSFMTLEPGDLIATGTPAGCGLGQRPQVWLQPGQVMDLSATGLGRQRQEVRADGV